MSSNLNVFISYAREDGREYADRLYRAFNERGISAWRDERNINPYQDFSGEIEKAIEESTHVVACLTPSIARRKDSFVRREIIYAQGWEKPITPLVMPGFDKKHIPTLINHLTWLDFQEFDEDFSFLLQRLEKADEFLAPVRQYDRFQDYLNNLYKDIVSYLDSTVFSLIALHASSTPDAVFPSSSSVRVRALPMGFVGQEFDEVNEDEELVHFTNFNQAYEFYRGRVLLLGEPGSGKTTTVMAFAREAIAKRLEDPTLPLPIVLPISSWPAENPPAFEQWVADKSGLVLQDVEMLITKGQALLMLDGLDELGEDRIVVKTTSDDRIIERFDPRPKFLEACTKLSDHNRIVLSCRIKEYEQIGQKIYLDGALTLQPLDDLQMAEYLQDQPALLEAVKSDEALHQMAKVPLLLSLLAFAYSGLGSKTQKLRDLGTSPLELREAIFETYVERRYEHEWTKPNARLNFSLDEIYETLGYAAMQDVNNLIDNEISVDHIAKIVGADASIFIEQMKRLHILVTPNRRPPRFIHLLLRDFFAFRYCLPRLNSDNPLVVLNLVQALGDIGDSRAIFPLLTVLKNNHVAQEQAAYALIKMGKVAVKPLVDSLESANASARRYISWILTQVSDTEIDTFKLLLSDKDAKIRRYAAKMLRDIKDDTVIEFLIEALNDRDNLVRQEVIWGLGFMKAKQAVDPLIDLLTDPIVGHHAADALGRIKDKRAIPALLSALDQDNFRLKNAASWALSQLGIR